MSSFRNRIAIRAIPMLGADKLMPRALAAGKAPSQAPGKRLARRNRITASEFNGRDVWKILPKKAVTSKTVLYHIHGGGFVVGMARAFYPAYARLADLTGCRVIAPDYPLPPQSTGTGIRTWSRAHYDQACETYGADNIVLSGDSAGANLALMLSQTAQTPARLLLWSPWADLTHFDAAQDAIITEPLIDIKTIRSAAARYAGDEALNAPLISPIFGDMKRLPPVTIYSGRLDLFHSDIERLFAVMKTAGVSVDLQAQDGCTHDYMYLPTPEAKAALIHMAGVINRV